MPWAVIYHLFIAYCIQFFHNLQKQEKGRISQSLEDLRQSSSAVVHELQFQLELEKSQTKELVTRTATLYGELAGKDSNLLKMEAQNKKLMEAAHGHDDMTSQIKSLKAQLKILEDEKKSLKDAKSKATQAVQALEEVKICGCINARVTPTVTPINCNVHAYSYHITVLLNGTTWENKVVASHPSSS